ncbi:hypothetical protein TWF718_000529 [Orbilia javanica]|uniref:VWFA domain-containing protein n=1 Tax=Orbilia javanica TaxID=47235 RepID=A0AAN8RM18_9PEZI
MEHLRQRFPFKFDFKLKVGRARRRSHDEVAEYPYGKNPSSEANPWSPATTLISPVSATQPSNPFGFREPQTMQSFVPPAELPDNAPNIPRPQYLNGAPANGNSGGNNLRPLSCCGHQDLPRIITNPPTMVDNTTHGFNRYVQPPISPPASPIGSSDLGLLKLYKTVFIVDDSTSMISSSHLKSAYDLLERLVPLAAQYGEKAVEIQFLSDDRQTHTQEIKLGDRLPPGEVFWDGVTARRGAAMSAGLKRVIKPYLSGIRKSRVLQKEGLNIIVITDGKRKDKKDVIKYIVSVARKLTDKCAPQHLLGIQFVQVGDDHGAKQFFQNVDDGLEKEYHIR